MDDDQRADLLRWGRGRLRDLPWRHTRDAWAVLVSEVMLQQTQAARVVPRYHEFLACFPTPAACAAAPAGDVLRLWQGLGYNRRALALHRAAQAVVAEFGGELPRTLAELTTLPGVGPYTARAVLAFAYEADVAVVDTNIARTLARWHGRSLSAAQVQALADDALARGEAWAWNQSIMELGATVCTARRPRCDECPVAPSCGWRGVGADPARGTAMVSGRQSAFVGSDRQGRGRLVRALGDGPVPRADLPAVLGWPDDPARAERVAATVVADGLAVVDPAGTYALP